MFKKKMPLWAVVVICVLCGSLVFGVIASNSSIIKELDEIINNVDLEEESETNINNDVDVDEDSEPVSTSQNEIVVFPDLCTVTIYNDMERSALVVYNTVENGIFVEKSFTFSNLQVSFECCQKTSFFVIFMNEQATYEGDFEYKGELLDYHDDENVNDNRFFFYIADNVSEAGYQFT